MTFPENLVSSRVFIDTFAKTAPTSEIQENPLKILFNKSVITKEQEMPKDLRGSIAITQDDKHTGMIHKIIFGFQTLKAGDTVKGGSNPNLCHAEVIISVCEEEDKKGHLVLGQAIGEGIIKSTEYHKTDREITAIHVYSPQDEKIKELFAKYAEQTTVNLAEEGLNPKEFMYAKKAQKVVGQYSIKKLIGTVFHKQALKPTKKQQKEAANAAADLLKGDKFRNSKGELKSFFCTSYVLTLAQASVLLASLSDEEEKTLKDKGRDEIAEHIFNRIRDNKEGDLLAGRYWQNDFMKVTPNHSMTYFAGKVLDRATIE